MAIYKKTGSVSGVKEAKRYEKVKEMMNEPQVPDGLFQKCDKCGEIIYTEDIITNYYICPNCNSYFRILPRIRLSMVLDKGSFKEWDTDLTVSDPLNFPGYLNKLEQMRTATGLDEAVITGEGKINGESVAIGVMASTFLMGSMGEVVGEKITGAPDAVGGHQCRDERADEIDGDVHGNGIGLVVWWFGRLLRKA